MQIFTEKGGEKQVVIKHVKKIMYLLDTEVRDPNRSGGLSGKKTAKNKTSSRSKITKLTLG